MFLNRMAIVFVVLAATLFVSAQGAFAQQADRTGDGSSKAASQHWKISRTRAKQILIEAGYSQIAGIHAKNGAWRGRGMENGISYRFRIDPQTGDLSQTEISAQPGSD